MSFEEVLNNWEKYYASTRQVGHTHSALNGVKNTKGVLVCAHRRHQEQIRQQGLNAVSMENTQLQGMRLPVVWDNYAISMLISKSLHDRIDKQRVRKLLKDYILLNSLDYPTKLSPKEQFEKLYKELGL